MSAIVRVVQIVGSQRRLADLLGVKAPTVSQWIKGRRQVPVLRCLEIERITRGEVSREDLRPDIRWEPPYGQTASADSAPPAAPGQLI